jgi:hypothetical protein
MRPTEITTEARNSSRCTVHIAYLFIYWALIDPNPLLLRPLIGLFYQHWMKDGEDFRAIFGMNDCQRKPRYSVEIAPVPLCPSQIPHDLIRARNLAAEVGSWHLTD